MFGFQLTFRCHSVNDARIADVSAFLALCCTEFDEASWEDEQGDVISDAISIGRSVETNRPKDFNKFGLTWVVKSMSPKPPIVVKVAVGGQPHAPNFFTIDLSRRDLTLPVDFMRKVIELVHPYEAFLSQQENERWIRDLIRNRESGPNNALKAIRPIHFLDNALVVQLGGVNKLKGLPMFRESSLLGGVLLEAQFTDFGHDLPSIQANAMEQLGLIAKMA